MNKFIDRVEALIMSVPAVISSYPKLSVVIAAVVSFCVGLLF